MTKDQFLAEGRALSSEAGVSDNFHHYFQASLPRLFRCCQLFGLFGRPLGDVLEVGPFYGYIPFFLRPKAASYLVLEGDDPAVYPLEDLYRRHDIEMRYIDFFDLFGPVQGATHTLPLPDNQYDTILCWETMEHFNFNPVKFVREAYRVLKPGGKIYITVPNRASLAELARVILGRGEENLIDSYYTFEDHVSNGKKCFYGFHWREYSSPEMNRLFTSAGFAVEGGTFTVFRAHAQVSFLRRMVRGLAQLIGLMFPRYGTYVYLVAEKPLPKT